MKRIHTLSLSAAALALLAGCGPSREEEQRQAMEEAAQQMEEAANAGDAAGAMEAFGEAMEGMAGNAEDRADPVDFRRLKELLPERAAGLRRTSHTGERTGAMGMTFSQAEADYEGDGGARAEVSLMDLAGVPTFGMLGFAWTMAEMDRETDTGYERTMEYGGYRGYEKYDRSDRSGQLQLIVADRFMVEVSGDDLDEGQFKAVVDDLDLKALERLRNEGR